MYAPIPNLGIVYLLSSRPSIFKPGGCNPQAFGRTHELSSFLFLLSDSNLHFLLQLDRRSSLSSRKSVIEFRQSIITGLLFALLGLIDLPLPPLLTLDLLFRLSAQTPSYSCNNLCSAGLVKKPQRLSLSFSMSCRMQ